MRNETIGYHGPRKLLMGFLLICSICGAGGAMWASLPSGKRADVWRAARIRSATDLPQFCANKVCFPEELTTREFIEVQRKEIELVKEQYGLPTGVLEAVILREIGDDAVLPGIFGVSKVTEQQGKRWILGALAHRGLYKDPRWEGRGPALGMFNVKPEQLNAGVVGAIRNDELRRELVGGIDSETGVVNMQRLQEVIDKWGISGELQIVAAIIESWLEPVYDYALAHGLRPEEERDLLSRVMSSFRGTGGMTGLYKLGIVPESEVP